MTDAKNRPRTLDKIVEDLLRGVADALGRLLSPSPQPVPVPIRKGPRR